MYYEIFCVKKYIGIVLLLNSKSADVENDRYYKVSQGSDHIFPYQVLVPIIRLLNNKDYQTRQTNPTIVPDRRLIQTDNTATKAARPRGAGSPP